jgi:hypothetical protein
MNESITKSKLDVLKESINGLKEVRVLLTDPKRWMQHDMAMDETGEQCSAVSLAACCWCLMGAIRRICWRRSCSYFLIENLIYRVLPPTMSVGYFNDWHTHAQVLELCDKAIAKAEEEMSA